MIETGKGFSVFSRGFFACLGIAFISFAGCAPVPGTAGPGISPGLPGAQSLPPDGALVMPWTRGRVIWDMDRVPDRDEVRLEFPDLALFGDHWYCAFREGDVHGNHLSGRARVIRSADGEEWETVALFEFERGDVRDPRLSVTAGGELMVNASIRYLDEAGPYEAVEGETGTRRSVTWLSSDGVDWGGPYKCPTGINLWRWDVTWHAGAGYSVAYSGVASGGVLWRTHDGRAWEEVKRGFFPRRRSSEAALAFNADGTAYCFLRTVGGDHLGIGRPPYDGEWSWYDLEEVSSPAADDPRFFGGVGGPKIVFLRYGRLLAAGRADSRVTLYLLEPEEKRLTRLLVVERGTSYPGLVEHGGRAWFTYSNLFQGRWGVYLASVSLESIPGGGGP